ncbi:MAG: hypothetical protein OK455_08070, partial [Thaumarchaeota archaeon]|nr:hypothetical protein [Nitrososphaerota archaeon]
VTTLDKESVDDPTRTGRSAISTSSSHLSECESSDGHGPSGLEYLLFWDADASLLCVGNPSSSVCSARLSLPLRSTALTTTLFAQVEELQQETGLWSKTERAKLTNTIETALELKPNSWKMLRFTPVRP